MPQRIIEPNWCIEGMSAVHSAMPAMDGSVWLTEQGSNKLGRWDPHTQKILEFQDGYIPGKLGYGAGSKHTVRFDDIPSTYDVKEDNNGNIWFTRPDTS